MTAAGTGATRNDVWPDDIFAVLKAAEVRQVVYVPDAGHARLIELCQMDDGIKTVPLTTEEEGIAVLAGAWLGGERGVLLMQSSGVGNCLNMLAMVQECRFPFLTLVTMRGEWGEFNPWQLPMGQSAARLLRDMGVIVQPVNEAQQVGETVNAAARLAFDAYRAVAVLISQRIIGFKNWAATGNTK
jgi:sulfopyruvate decarboxylase alpha subunit